MQDYDDNSTPNEDVEDTEEKEGGEPTGEGHLIDPAEEKEEEALVKEIEAVAAPVEEVAAKKSSYTVAPELINKKLEPEDLFDDGCI